MGEKGPEDGQHTRVSAALSKGSCPLSWHIYGINVQKSLQEPILFWGEETCTSPSQVKTELGKSKSLQINPGSPDTAFQPTPESALPSPSSWVQ